jgi:hypothetical protein
LKLNNDESPTLKPVICHGENDNKKVSYTRIKQDLEVEEGHSQIKFNVINAHEDEFPLDISGSPGNCPLFTLKDIFCEKHTAETLSLYCLTDNL